MVLQNSARFFSIINHGRLNSSLTPRADLLGKAADCKKLRHTMVSIAKTVVPELALKDVIGHTPSMDTFGVYGHVVNGELQQTATQIDEAFSKVLK